MSQSVGTASRQASRPSCAMAAERVRWRVADRCAQVDHPVQAIEADWAVPCSPCAAPAAGRSPGWARPRGRGGLRLSASAGRRCCRRRAVDARSCVWSPAAIWRAPRRPESFAWLGSAAKARSPPAPALRPRTRPWRPSRIAARRAAAELRSDGRRPRKPTAVLRHLTPLVERERITPCSVEHEG
jgi:hypothetical protein